MSQCAATQSLARHHHRGVPPRLLAALAETYLDRAHAYGGLNEHRP